MSAPVTTSQAAMVGVLAGCVLPAAGLAGVLVQLDESVVWQMAVAVGATAVYLLVSARLAWLIEDRRYRHNEVHLLVEGEVGQ